MKKSNVFAVIMAGGRGTRFWPASTKARPKQFMELLQGGTMLQKTAGRFANISGPENVLVVTGADHKDIVTSQLPLLTENNLLLEPTGRNTAACIGWAAETLFRRGFSDSIMVVAASDHKIEPVAGFESTIDKAIKLAQAGNLCTIGIPPTHPATGYGYLQLGEPVGAGNKVQAFKEKPDEKTALSYLSSGDYLWNSGMFVWRVDVFLRELSKYMPELFSDIKDLPDTTSPSREIYSALQSESVDYGIMEKTQKAVVLPAEFEWSDIGDWLGARAAGVSKGEKILIDSNNSLVFDETGRLTVLIGIDNVSVVSTAKATLVIGDSSSQEIKTLVAELDKSKPEFV